MQLALIRQEIAGRKARGLPPLRESSSDWQAFLKAFAGYQVACREMGLANPGYLAGLEAVDCKAGFDPTQPRVPAGNPDGGQWTGGSTGGGAGSSPGHSCPGTNGRHALERDEER